MIKQLIGFSRCEQDKGNVLLDLLDGDGFEAYLRLPGGGYLGISYRSKNHPMLDVTAMDVSKSELVEHINQHLQGMIVVKANLDGLDVDECGCIRDLEAEMDEDDEALIPVPSTATSKGGMPVNTGLQRFPELVAR